MGNAMLLAKHWVCEQDKDELLLPAWQRLVDVMARFGGDEFVVMCQESQPLDINKIVQRLKERIAKKQQQPQLSFSYGYASIKPMRLIVKRWNI